MQVFFFYILMMMHNYLVINALSCLFFRSPLHSVPSLSLKVDFNLLLCNVTEISYCIIWFWILILYSFLSIRPIKHHDQLNQLYCSFHLFVRVSAGCICHRPLCCYIEFKFRYLKNLKLFSIGDGCLLFMKAISWETDLWITLGEFALKTAKLGGEFNLK